MDLDVFRADTAAFAFPRQAGGEEDMDELGGHSGGGGRYEQRTQGGGTVAGFLQKLPGGGVGQGFVGEFLLVADDPGGDFDHAALYGDAELLDEDDFVHRSHGENADTEIGIRAAHEIPMAAAVERQPAGVEEKFGIGHRFGEKRCWYVGAGAATSAPPMPETRFQIPVLFKHRVLFTRGAFDAGNPAARELLAEGGGRRVWAVVEEQVAAAWPSLCDDISGYLSTAEVAFSGLRVLPGGEEVKADDALVRRVWEDLDAAHIDRHSYLLAVGGGAFLDAVGFAAVRRIAECAWCASRRPLCRRMTAGWE